MICKNSLNESWVIKFIYEKRGDIITTLCKMYPLKKEDGPMLIDSVNKAFEDQHVKSYARKMALKKVLGKYFKKKDRRAFWVDYLAQTKPDRVI